MDKKLREDARVVVAIVARKQEALLEVTDENGSWLYGAEDWRDTAAPSFGWDASDLPQHDGQMFYGRVIEVLDVAPDAALAQLLATWPDQAGVFA